MVSSVSVHITDRPPFEPLNEMAAEWAANWDGKPCMLSFAVSATPKCAVGVWQIEGVLQHEAVLAWEYLSKATRESETLGIGADFFEVSGSTQHPEYHCLVFTKDWQDKVRSTNNTT